MYKNVDKSKPQMTEAEKAVAYAQKPWLVERLWARLKSNRARKAVQKPLDTKPPKASAPFVKKAAKAYVAMYPILMGLAVFAAVMVAGVVGSLGWHFVATMVQAFVVTVAAVFQPKFVGLALAVAFALTAVLSYKKDKERVQKAAKAQITGVKPAKSTGEYAKYFQFRNLVLGLAVFAFLTGGALISILVFKGGKALWMDGGSILDKVLATKVVVITAIGSALYGFVLWYSRKRRQWAKEARRQAYAQRAAKTGKDQTV